ncbi:MAG: TrkA family potassium uptake protein [Nitrospinota bacterium]|nr:TrkA family potassium uptake protein [Nitrospinota bacterium]
MKKTKRFAVIGLGKFGFYLARSLFERGHDVISIDIDKDVVQEIKDYSTQAIIADATNKDTLLSLGIKDVDIAIVSLGTRMDHSILVTLHLKEIGLNEIVVKAITEDHRKILSMIGATEVIFPERDMAEKLAHSLSSPNIMDFLPLTEGVSIMEVVPLKSFVGKSIKDIQLRNKFGVQVIAVKEIVPERMNLIPAPDTIVKESDVLVLMGRDEDLAKLEDQSE